MPVAVVPQLAVAWAARSPFELGGRGFFVHVTDIDPDAAARTADEIGAGARSAALDVRDEAACRALAAEAAARGTLDVWVNNAGVLYTALSCDPDAAGSFSGSLLTAEQVAREIGKLTERPRPLLILPRWRGLQLRLLDLFPRLTMRLLPLALSDARRKQRRYKKLIQAGKWPK